MTTETAPVHAGAALGLQRQPEAPEPRELPVRGTLPDWLGGTLLRNGPGDWQPGEEELRHWFDGAAMLHAFAFADGRVTYASRFLDSDARRAATAHGEQRRREFATDPCRSIFQRVHSLFRSDLTDNANVSVHRLGDRLLAMTELPMPLEFDAATLERVGHAYRAPGQITTAHPHYDRADGGLINYAIALGPRSAYRIYRVGPDGAPDELARVPVREPSYMHSFGLTERYVVLSEFPLVVDPLRLALSADPFIANYRWRPERGTRFTVIDRATGEVRARLTGPACFGFHHINAFDDGDRVVVDIGVSPDARLIDDLYLDRIRGRLDGTDATSISAVRPTRFELDLAAGDVAMRALWDGTLELPVVNHRMVRERPYTTVWGVGSDGTWIDRVVRLDVETGEAREWREPGASPGEPVFVPRPGATAEDDGVLLTVVLDGPAGSSSLVVLDAATLEEVARADVGRPVPYGFHGLHVS